MTDINEENKDLINNMIPLGLLDKETQERMRAWPHGWEKWSSRFDAWRDMAAIYADDCEKVYRAKPAPKPPLRAVQWHYLYCKEAKEELKKNKKAYLNHDTSHDLSVIDSEGARHRIGTFKHSEWASEIGKLIEKHGLSGIQ